MLYEKAFRAKGLGVSQKNNKAFKKNGDLEKKNPYEKKEGDHIDEDEEEEEEEDGEMDLNNINTTDVVECSEFLWSVHETWVCILEILISFAFLYHKVQSAIWFGVIPCIFISVGNLVVAKFWQQAYTDILKIKDRRISLTVDVIQGIKALKFLSWEKIFERN